MTELEIIKAFDKEVGLFTVEENEDELGNLYIDSMQLKSAEKILGELVASRARHEAATAALIHLAERITQDGIKVRKEEHVHISGEEIGGELILICERAIISHNQFLPAGKLLVITP